jgi:hypothetical protein
VECVLCEVWGLLPYAKRYTTPTTAHETEMALVFGYWTRRRQENKAARMCPRHLQILEMLDSKEAPSVQMQPVPTLPAGVTPRHFPMLTVDSLPPVLYGGTRIQTPAPVAPPTKDFHLGPGPLLNGNTITAQPELPQPPDPIQPYRAPPGTPEGALEAARMPAEQGANVSFPCMLCGKDVKTGETHAC